jgi:hypothetical protein
MSEVATERVVTEQGQVARIDREKQAVHLEDVTDGKGIAWLTREVEARPVWDSNLVLGLTAAGRIGYMQLHWPELGGHVVGEAHRLAHRMGGGWSAPDLAGASVESAEAGIVHSPAVAMVMDVYAAIRVIYRSDDPRFGQRPVVHVDRHGGPVPIPRQFHGQIDEHQGRVVPTAEPPTG